MTSKPPLKRSDAIRKSRAGRRSPAAPRPTGSPVVRHSFNARTIYLPNATRPRPVSQPPRKPGASRAARHDSRYDISFSLGRTSVRAPALSMPRFDFSNPRWVSGLITLVLGVLLILLWNSSTFTVSAVEAVGNQYHGAGEISKMSGIENEPVFKAVPAQISTNLRTAFPGLAEVKVKVHMPNRVLVEVVERTPLIAWYQKEEVTWIDAEGIAFVPHGEAVGLVAVISNGSPRDVRLDPELPAYQQPFINPEVVQAILNLAPHVPEGMLMIYDPEYGIGWQDPRGWVVQFGHDTRDLHMKLTVYQALVERFIAQGIQPTLISMEFLDAPFYK